MFYDTIYRHDQALSPAGLETLPAALHALNAAVGDCQRAGNPKGRTPLFRDPETRAICRIPAFRKRAYRIVHAAIVPKDAANG